MKNLGKLLLVLFIAVFTLTACTDNTEDLIEDLENEKASKNVNYIDKGDVESPGDRG